LIALLAMAPAAGRAGTTERVVSDRFTGLAIAGFDPVAYFTDARPLPGDAAYELSEQGVVWRFRNESNRASFAAHPEIYGPQFGGYDPVDVARGVAYPGNPQLWLVVDQRLYLFGREESRDAFAAAPAAVLAEARKRWTVLRSELSR
jgi:YHS domain-containing protein